MVVSRLVRPAVFHSPLSSAMHSCAHSHPARAQVKQHDAKIEHVARELARCKCGTLCEASVSMRMAARPSS
jgi:hypothetical protein